MKSFTNKITLITFGISFLLSSCKKDELTTTPKDIYIAGKVYNSSFKNTATLWKNGVATNLSDGSFDASAEAICVVGSDVYVAFNENGYAKIWKNGTASLLKSNLINDKYSSFVNSIFVSNTDVYAVGTLKSLIGKSVATIWKNGIATSLSTGSMDAYADYVFISNNDVYVLGYELSSTGAIIKLWKNGIATNITNGNTKPNNKSLFVENNDVYILWEEVNSARKEQAKLWKNGEITNLSDGTTWNYPRSLFVKNKEVYVVGVELNNLGYSAKLWKNNTASYLINGSLYHYAYSVFVDGTDVYVAGIGDAAATYWKNGIATNLTDTNTTSSANAIFVK
jgi:hypothetical protein